jgi:hypothetical protein
MKRILAILAVAIALATTQSASAQSSSRPHASEITYASSAYLNCYVNGVTYPVDSAFNVWAWNGYGWYIAGELVNTGGGYYVVRNDGIVFAARCY